MYPHPAVIIYFYPRPLRGGRRAKAAIEDADEIFLSTPSARRATHELDHGQRAQVISIHALCEEGDFHFAPDARPPKNFYPRPLRGGRPKDGGIVVGTVTFLSTPSARRATLEEHDTTVIQQISIHALCEEGDYGSGRSSSLVVYFYPRPLRGGRRQKASESALPQYHFYPRPLRGGRPNAAGQHAEPDRFLSTPSARRATPAGLWCARCSCHFYPRPLRGGRPCIGRRDQVANQFLSTPSARRATQTVRL